MSKPVQQHITLKPSQAIEAVTTAISADTAFHLQGSPGVGKSAIVFEAARRLGYRVIDIRLLIREPIDVIGLPHIDDNGRTAYSRPVILPDFDDPTPTLLFFDELNAAPPMVQACAYSVMYASPGLPRMLGEHPLPMNVRVGAAGNYDTDRAVTHRMPTPLRSRMVHINFVADLDDFCAWGASDGKLHPVLLAFLRYRPALLHDFSHDAQTFPCPRTWEMVSRLLEAEPKPEIEHALLSGAVGDGAAGELVAYMRTWRSLPDIDAVIADPKKAPVPRNDMAVLYAISAALAHRANVKNFGNICQYLERLPREFGVFAVRDIHNRDSRSDKKIQTSKAFIDWAVKNQDVLL